MVARELGFTFSKQGRVATKLKHKGFELFSVGDKNKIKREMWGECDGGNVSIFEYGYRERSGRNSNWTYQTVISMEHQGLDCPGFELMPEKFIDKLNHLFGSQDVDFECFPKFSKKYVLRSNNEDEVRQYFNLNVIKFFELHQDVSMEGLGNTLIFYRRSKEKKPKELVAGLNEGQKVLKGLLANAP